MRGRADRLRLRLRQLCKQINRRDEADVGTGTDTGSANNLNRGQHRHRIEGEKDMRK